MSVLSLRRAFAGMALLASMLVPGAFAYAEFQVPALTSPVMDQAGMLDSNAASELDAILRDLRAKGGPQINVLTVSTLEGMPIEMATIKVTDAWKLGSAKKDDGVLLLIAAQDRKLRIEVGQGLEGDLTDIASKRIIDDQVVPYFRAGRASDGIVVGVRAIIEKTAPDYFKSLGDAPVKVQQTTKKRSRGLPWPFLILLLFFLIFRGRGQRRSGLLGALTGAAIGSSLGRGGGGFGGGGGGSWGGGGGGFSGGGASGGW